MTSSQELNRGLWHCLQESHRHLDAVLQDVQQLAIGQSFVTAAKRFGEFRLQEERHLHAEDELLLILEGNLKGPKFEGIRSQHRRIVQLMDELTALLSCWDLPAFDETLKKFVTVLAAHEADEMQSVLPQAEAALKDIPAYQTMLWRVGHP
jgi:hypothetical protein